MSASSDQTHEHKIAELEVLIMQHENSIESLSSTMHRQQLHIEKLTLTLEALADRMKTMQEESAVRPIEEEPPPPHY